MACETLAAELQAARSLFGLIAGIGLAPETSAGGGLEVSAESGSQERSEDNLGATEDGEGEPEKEEELEDIVKGEPVNDVNEALDNSEESENDPVSQPLGVIFLVGREKGPQGVVPRDDEASEVGEELTTEVEDDEEEIEGGEADDGVGLGNASRLLEVIEGGVLGELLIELPQIVLGLILSGHCED